eukprot:gene30311-57475_t
MFTGLAKIYCDEGSPGAAPFMADPRLAVAAYDAGCCDDELLALTSERGMLAEQAAYLVKRGDAGRRAEVVHGGPAPCGPHRRHGAPCRRHGTVLAHHGAATVWAPPWGRHRVGPPWGRHRVGPLTAVLEKLVLDDDAGARVGDSRYQQNLQNLLLKTTIRGRREKLMAYISRLSNYDHDEVAEYALKEGLHEEAFAVYRRKEGGELRAMQVLLNNVQSVERAKEYAAEVRSR